MATLRVLVSHYHRKHTELQQCCKIGRFFDWFGLLNFALLIYGLEIVFATLLSFVALFYFGDKFAFINPESNAAILQRCILAV